MIYVIVSDGGPVKIGISDRPEARLRNLVQSQPHDAKIVFTREVPKSRAREIEAYAHALLADKAMRCEWFSCTEQEAIAAVKKAANPRRQHIVSAQYGKPTILNTKGTP